MSGIGNSFVCNVPFGHCHLSCWMLADKERRSNRYCANCMIFFLLRGKDKSLERIHRLSPRNVYPYQTAQFELG